MVSQKVVVILLIIAIVFSLVSVALTLTLKDFEPVGQHVAQSPGVGANSGGNLQLSVEPNTGTNG